MTSLAYLPQWETVFQSFQTSENQFEQTSTVTKIIFLEQLSRSNPPYPVLYYKLAECYFKTK
jgi:hypothetical protein